MAQMNLPTEQKQMPTETRLVVVKGEGQGVGWMGSVGFVDAN